MKRALILLFLVPTLLSAEPRRKPRHVYSPALAGNIVGSCSKQGIAPEICLCFLDQMERTFSEREFQQLAVLSTTGRPMPQAFQTAIKPCLKLTP